MIELISNYQEAWLKGTYNTFFLYIGALVIGLSIGLPGAFAYLTSTNNLTRKTIQHILSIFGTVPVLAIMFWLHYPAQQVIDKLWSPFISATISLGLVNATSVATILIKSIDNMNPKFIMTARMATESNWTLYTVILIPTILISSLPALILSQIAIIHGTMFASLISVSEIFRVAQQINAIENRPVELFSIIILFYTFTCIPIIAIAGKIKKLSNTIQNKND